MLTEEFNKEEGILYITPHGRLEKGDFDLLASEIDPFIKKNGKVNGILIDVKDFPFWKNLDAIETHFKFVRSHHENVKRIAIVSDFLLASVLPVLARLFMSTEIKHFAVKDRDQAKSWLHEIPENLHS